MKLRLIAATILSMSLALPSAPVFAATVSTNSAIKGASNSAVYWYATDGKRYVFPTEGTYYSWFSDFSNVKTISDSELASITIGGNVTYRPGSKLIKITTDPRTYAVSKGGYLRLIGSESVATSLYGSNWAKQVHDLPDPFFINYKMGSTVYSYSDYNVSGEYNGVSNPSDSIFNGTTPTTPGTNNGVTSVTLATSRSYINEGEAVTLTGRLWNAPSYGYRLDLIDFRNGSVVRSCDNTTSCDTTVYPYRLSNGSNTVQYFIALKRTSDNYEVTREYSPVITFNGTAANGIFSSGSSQLDANKTSINNGDSITLTGSIWNVTVPDNTLRMEFYRERDNALLYTCYDSRNCNYTFQVNAAYGMNSERYYVIAKNDNNEQIPAAYSPRIAIANANNNGSYSMSASVNKTSLASGELANFTAQFLNAPSTNYRIEIYNQNNSLRTTCSQSAYCYLVEAVTRSGSQTSATYYAYAKDNNNNVLASAAFPAIAFTGSSNTVTTLTGTPTLTVSPAGTRPAYSQVTLTANVTNYNVATSDMTIYIWAGVTPAVVQTCTNTSSCTANYNVGAANASIPVYMSVTANNASNALQSSTSWIYTN